MNDVKVSLLLPSYNVVKYIDQCLSSVIQQTLREIEILCIDAESDDGTAEIIRKYEKMDERVHLIAFPIRSYGAQMNMGVERAKGKYIGIVETDDMVPPEMFKELYQIAVQKDLDLIKANFFEFTTQDGKMNRLLRDITAGRKEYQNRIVNLQKERECFTFLMNTWSGIYKTEFIRGNHILHNESLGAAYQDNGFWFQTFIYASRAYFLDKPYYLVRRDNPTSSVNDRDRVLRICDEYQYIYEILKKDQSIFETYKYDYVYRCYASYKWALNRISLRNRPQLLRRFIEDFRRFSNEEMISMDIFRRYNNKWEKELELILEEPESFYRKFIGEDM